MQKIIISGRLIRGSRCENRIFEKHDHDDGADCEKIRDQRRDAVAEYVL